jgi:hypothetical protein
MIRRKVVNRYKPRNDKVGGMSNDIKITIINTISFLKGITRIRSKIEEIQIDFQNFFKAKKKKKRKCTPWS